MADEIVSSISDLKKTMQKLEEGRQAEAEKAEKDRTARMKELNSIDKEAKANGKGNRKEAVAARAELKQIKKAQKLDSDINLEVSRSAAEALGISVEQLQLRKEAKQQLDDQKVGLDKLEEAIKASGGDPAQNAEFQRRTLAHQDAMKAAEVQGRTKWSGKEEVEEMKAQLEKNGQVATDSKEFNKLQYEVQKAELAERLKNADSPAARKEIKNEQRALAAKQEGLLGKIAGGMNFLRDSAKEKLKSAGKGIMAILKGTLVAGFALALVAFLNSSYWEDTKNYIVDVLVPKLQEFYNAFFGEGGGFINGIKALFGDKGGIGGIVLGIGSAAALFAAFKFAPLIKAVKGFLGGIGSFASKLTGIGGGKGGAAAKGGAIAKGGGKGGGAGKGIANIGKGIGKGLGGILRGIAGGFMAFANPAVAIGAAAFAAAIVLVGGAVAGASYLLGKAMPTLSSGFKSFEELDGNKLLQVGKGIAAIGAGMAAFGAGKAVEGVGSLVGSIAGLFGGKDKLTPLEQLKIFGDTQINSAQATANAKGLVSYSKAMAMAGGAEASVGVGSFIGGMASGLVKLFGGDSPLDKLKEFGDMDINQSGIIKNAAAVAEYSKAMSLLKGDITGADLVKSERANRVNQAGVERSGGGGTPVVVNAPSTNVVNSSTSSSATHMNTAMANPNPTVAALNLSY